jgi:hypothetical protein
MVQVRRGFPIRGDAFCANPLIEGTAEYFPAVRKFDLAFRFLVKPPEHREVLEEFVEGDC